MSKSCFSVIDVSYMSLFWFCSPSEKWLAMCWWRSTSLTTCHWRTWGSFEASRCTRAAILWPSSSTTDGTATTAWGSWACATSQVWNLAWVVQHFFSLLRAITFKLQKNSKHPFNRKFFLLVVELLFSPYIASFLLSIKHVILADGIASKTFLLSPHRRQALFLFARFGSHWLREGKPRCSRRSSSWGAAVTSNLSRSAGAQAQGHFSFLNQTF